MSNICPNCGTDTGNAKFCPECGTKIETENTATTATENEQEKTSVENATAENSSAENASVENATENAPENIPGSAAGAPAESVVNSPYGNPQGYYESLKAIEEEKAKKSKKKKVAATGCLSIILVIALIIGIPTIVKKNSLTANEKLEVNEVISSIEALPGELKIEDESKVKEIKKDYDALNEKQKKKVKNHKLLEEAQEEIDSIKINEVVDAIKKIGTVSDKSGDAIAEAVKKYEKLPNELKDKVSNYKELTDKQKEYDTIGAEKVISAIKDLGEITLKSKDKIKEIDKLYDQLTDEGKKLVTNAEDLKTAKKQYNDKYKKEYTKKLNDLLKKFKAKRDDVEKCTFYECATEPRYINDRCYILPYLRYNDDGSMYIRIRAVCVDDEWVFWKSLKVVIDDGTYTKEFNYFDIERDHNRKNNWEYADYLCNADDILALSMIAGSKSATARFRGDAHSKDFTISAADKASIKDMMQALTYYACLTDSTGDNYFDV